MADQETQIDAATLTEARNLGWKPLEQFKGKPEQWVDADVFVQRGHEVMPLLKANNATLVTKLAETQAALDKAIVLQTTQGQAIKDLTAFQAAEIKRQVTARVGDIKEALRAARKGGDDDLVAVLEDKLDEAKDAVRALPVAPPPPSPAPPAPKPPTAPAVEPWAQEFNDANADWLGKDARRTGLFAGIADELFKTTDLRGPALMEKAKADMLAVFGEGEPGDKSEAGGGRGAGGGGGGARKAKTYANLPADAKAVCDDQERKMVGSGRPFKDQAGWRKHYAEVFLND